ncbi:HD domain-containing protein [Bacillus luteolus]|uniref:HD domain-containing protein n=1 Tax=Litchfieldia luteola TaxID=682179 RepID=A0ABR9QFP2_9BACI|nr:HD domain-containing protein [Cytobacillus luteolus]MBE4907313.1 HD domain-containing protein [Cytobacillus luteolus]MBP1943859.1 HD superfamily phosphohydrolase [Cytobacillus luteolus]
MVYVFKEPKEFIEPFYQTSIRPFPCEVELLESKAFRRLKFLSHYGTGSLITSAKHTRFEHTIGVWAIVSTFFPKEEELRIAALLHDIGHLPFSHAVERTLGFNHHTITEENIRGQEISTILNKYGYDPNRIIEILDNDSPLSHKTPYLSADHLDSFLRDAYMLGKIKEHPATIFKNLSFNHQYVEANLDTSKHIIGAIYEDHRTFLKPISLALDSMLAKAISIFASEKEVDLQSIQSLTNNELLQLLQNANIEAVNKILSIILWYPEKVSIHEEDTVGAVGVEVKKVYDKTPLVNGTPLTEICSDTQETLEAIRAMKKMYYYSY